MEIRECSNLDFIPKSFYIKALRGRWYTCNRTFIVQLEEDKFALVTLNIFERISNNFLKIFNVNCFSKVFDNKKITFLSPKTISFHEFPPEMETEYINNYLKSYETFHKNLEDPKVVARYEPHTLYEIYYPKEFHEYVEDKRKSELGYPYGGRCFTWG